MAPVIVESEGALRTRRDAIYARLGQTPSDFRRLVETRTLTAEEWDARDELDEIEFLLGDDSEG